jgi:hypothetical protein
LATTRPVAHPAAEAAVTEPQPAPRLPWWQTGWAPAALLLVCLAVLLHHYHVTYVDLVKYTLFLALLICLPGTLIWRAVTRRAHAFGEEVAAGTAVGFALEVLTYIPARALGLPLLVLVWPVATVVVFAAVPALRQYWRGTGPAGRAPWWHSWSLTALLGLIVLYSAATVFRATTVTEPGYGVTDSDTTWFLANIGELKNHMPPQLPYAPVGPLLYHWFTLADMAATSWVTGIEPFILLRRLSVLPYLAILALLISAITRHLTGRWWTGPVALLVAFFVVAPQPYNWTFDTWQLGTYGFGLFEDGSLLRWTLWFGPPQSFGAALFAPLMLLLVSLLRKELRGVWPWLLFAVLVVALAGGKATFIPMLLAGLALMFGVGLLRRQVHMPALAAGVLVAAGLALSTFVLLRQATSDLVVRPLSVMEPMGLPSLTGVLSGSPPPMAWVFVVGLSVLCWVCIWGGLFGVRNSTVTRSPEVLVFVGIGIAGLVGVLTFGHSGMSQEAFIQGARPYFSIAAVVGFASLVSSSGLGRKAAVTLAAAAGAGTALVLVLRLVGSPTVPNVEVDPGGYRHTLIALAWPYAVLFGLTVIAAVVLFRWPRTRAAAPALLLAALMGMGLEPSLHDKIVTPVGVVLTQGSYQPSVGLVTDGTLEAGRWLRDHSDPSDVVATNAHCLFPVVDGCTNARFSTSAFTERRTLIEGWGGNSGTEKRAQELGILHWGVPWWGDPSLLADNDAAFATPSAQTIGLLRDKYGVTWLFVDRTQTPPAADLGQFAKLRFSLKNCDVYEVPAAS